MLTIPVCVLINLYAFTLYSYVRLRLHALLLFYTYAYKQAGHMCGDNVDLINGRPTGSVRVSFGYMSSLGDANKLVRFVEQNFREVSRTATVVPVPGAVRGSISVKGGSYIVKGDGDSVRSDSDDVNGVKGEGDGVPSNETGEWEKMSWREGKSSASIKCAKDGEGDERKVLRVGDKVTVFAEEGNGKNESCISFSLVCITVSFTMWGTTLPEVWLIQCKESHRFLFPPSFPPSLPLQQKTVFPTN